MEGTPKKRRLLFLHADTRNPTAQRRTRSKSLDSKVRRHLMVDIGMSRRKPSKAPQFVTFVWSLAETSAALSNTGQDEHSTSRDVDHLQVPAKHLVAPETAAQYTALHIAEPPILHALSVFEKEWGEDSFSAYGFALIMVAGRNAMGSSMDTQVLHRLQFLPTIANIPGYSLLNKHLLVPLRLQKIRLPSPLPTNLHFTQRPYPTIPQIRQRAAIPGIGTLLRYHSVRRVQAFQFWCK